MAFAKSMNMPQADEKGGQQRRDYRNPPGREGPSTPSGSPFHLGTPPSRELVTIWDITVPIHWADWTSAYPRQRAGRHACLGSWWER